MHVQEVVIDGFKSYAHRTVITGFDTHFNAITGLNGSGKSNILDAICFVLGISNLSQVRAGNLSELVYKQGQAGITKASVTVVFDNRDESTSPVGYEQNSEVTVTRQVLIGGKSKYLINGKVQSMNQVNNLFHSVQLNVNNPHFLIMQGRITKVLNMKPQEILGMVEEAAGTRMYETKRVTAIKTIDKKQMKLDELNSILTEEITPTLERLRGEKQHYLKWSKNNADIERLERFVVAYEFAKAEEMVQTSGEDVEKMEEETRRQEELITQCASRVEEKEAEIEGLNVKLSGDFQELHRDVKVREEKLAKEVVQVTSAWKNCQAVAKDALKDLDATKGFVVETKEAVVSKENQIIKDKQKIEKPRMEAEKAENELVRLQEEYQNMCAGISSEEGGDGGTLPDQISKSHKDAKNAEARAKQAQMKITHLSKSAKSVEKDMKKEESSSTKLSNKKTATTAKVENLSMELSKLNFSSKEFSELDDQKVQLEKSVSVLQDTVETLSAQLQGRLSFQYSDPVRGFDKSKVKGIMARLVTVKDSRYATALEVVAGGKLYQVVVDEAITGKALLERGKLQKRVTIIPLDKITSRCITSATSERAGDIASKLGSASNPAIELVGFEEEVRNAVEYVFGSALIVDGSNAANRICDMMKTKTVTLEGDVYDPSGTISGGSNTNLGTTLSKITALAIAKSELQEKETSLEKIVGRLRGMQAISIKYEKVNNQLEFASAELAAVEKNLSQTSYGMLSETYQNMTKEINDNKVEMEDMNREKDEKWSLYNELKDREKDLTREREERLKRVDKSLKLAKKHAEKTSKTLREAESTTQTLALELEELQSEVIAAEAAVGAAEKSYMEANAEEISMQVKVSQQKSLYDEVKSELEKVENQLAQYSSELKSLNKEKSKLNKQAESAQLDAKKLEVKVSKFRKEKGNAENAIGRLLKKYTWIEMEKEAFGVEGGDYDFEEVDAANMGNKLKGLKEEQANLVKKINKKVMGMIEKAEGEYTELLRKRKVVENDKKKIQAVIEQLDIKKKTELERTWVKVNGDFGSIFSTLLPGTSAKLEPPEGLAAWEGLEVKVAFGGVWKESLTELSGGQRSLLALSLILSMLLFKPAPMYILDEVDAALDLSHTQNIGNMLKTHFSQSQFIVVSLKEGMFNNANVIFRTKFVDGVSTVARTMGIGSSSNHNRRLPASSSRNKKNGNSNSSTSEEESSPEMPPARKRTASGQQSHRMSGKENA